MENYSVLMSVYRREKPAWLRQSMESMLEQTVKTDDFVLVCDGPLTPELDQTVADFETRTPQLHVIRLPENRGLGRALNAGMEYCRNDLVARMDSDDISRPDRCEKQLKVFEEHPELAIVSGTVEEFSETPEKVEARRILPEDPEEILSFAGKRNPFNHPCVMYRKSAVEAAGGYRDFYLLEDYDLWIRMLKNGARGTNIREPLLWMRAGSDMYKRRSGRKYAASQRALFREIREAGLIGEGRYLLSSAERTVSSLLPNGLRKRLFRKVLRKEKKEAAGPKLRVLMLTPNLQAANGVASFAVNYFRGLDHERVQMDFAVYQRKESPYEQEIISAGGRIFLLPPAKSHPVRHTLACRALLKKEEYDIIHDTSLTITIPMMWAAKKRIPVRILHSHSTMMGETPRKSALAGRLLPILLKQITHRAACSEKAARAVFGDQEYELIPNVIRPDSFCFDPDVRNRVRREMQAENKTVILTVGRAAPAKNPLFALEVFDILAERMPEAEYWWVGDGVLEQEMADRRKQLKHGDRVRMLGSREDAAELYQAADVFFLPSIFEGLPVTVLEAQAAGLPCLLSDVITREVSYTDLLRYHSLQEGAESWANCLAELSETEKGARRSREKELLESPFSAGDAGKRLEAYYRRITGK